jgi:Putative beta-barrel porin-2, OmpL-like. bbp2
MRVSSDVRPTPIHAFFPKGSAIIVISLLGLAGSAVRGQQSYIPWASSQEPRTNAFAWRDPRVKQPQQKEQVQAALTLSGSAPGVRNATESAIGDNNEGPKTYDGFATRLFDAYFGKKEEDAEEEESRRPGAEAPFSSPPFPFGDYIGPYIGYRDTTVYPLMDAVYHGPNADLWKKSRIKIYGWAAPTYNASTSRNSNLPLAYGLVPNHIELSQGVLIFERVTDSVQTDHLDWGFKFTNVYGTDYRFTTAKGFFSDQLLKHNNLYGYDPLQMYVDLYIPWIREGTIIRTGRFISPMDIEAQLSPDNYLYTHSLMNTYDPFTLTGIQISTRLSSQWHILGGVHAGGDMAPWTTSSQPNGMLMLKWVSTSGNDSLFGGVESIGHGYFKNGHDDLQVVGMTWGHRFSSRFHTMTEAYYVWERNALLGGTVIDGPPYPFFTRVGPGRFLPGLSDSFGIVNYTAYKTSDKSYIVLRSDCLDDPRGYRTGFPGAFFEHTLGFIYHLTPWCLTRPEVRFDYTTGQKAYDNGTRREQFTFNWDIIIRF